MPITNYQLTAFFTFGVMKKRNAIRHKAKLLSSCLIPRALHTPNPSFPILWLSALHILCSICLQLSMELSTSEVLLKAVRHNLPGLETVPHGVHTGRTSPHTSTWFQFYTCIKVTPYATNGPHVRQRLSKEKRKCERKNVQETNKTLFTPSVFHKVFEMHLVILVS